MICKVGVVAFRYRLEFVVDFPRTDSLHKGAVANVDSATMMRGTPFSRTSGGHVECSWC